MQEHLRVSGLSRSISASAGEDVTLSCSVDSHITPEDLEVSWMKTDEDGDIVVLLYQNNEASPEASDERYRDRVEFFTDEIPKGNFSLRLKSVRTEDKGVYMCEVSAGGLSANTTVELEQLGFSVLHIMVLILCISASGSALLLFCLIYCRSSTKGLVHNSNTDVHLGGSVVLPCHVPPNLLTEDLKVEWRKTTKNSAILVHLYEDEILMSGKVISLGGSVDLPCQVKKSLLENNLKVEWRRTDSETLVHLYEDGKSQTDKQHKDYHKRAHFLKKKIKDGNFSLRLKKLRDEDEGIYRCKVYRGQNCVCSANEELKLESTSNLILIRQKCSFT
ncbi:butyrophilin 2 [Labeo rohita]|uniref:Butyrophilin 2 n=1 Tax=Labeo rohita TaxID=84645 RepID=A0A498NXT5_LABRO|nr:butyrophilin 2 [Labeo rohita]